MPLETPLRAAHEKAGAAFGVYFNCLLPERFTDIPTEYAGGHHSVVLIDTNYHAFFYLDGPDRVRYLNAVLTNNVRGLTSGHGNISLMLNPQGHILAEVEVYALEDRLLCVTHSMVRERTAATLDKFIIMDDVTLTDASEHLASLAIEGPAAADALRHLCGTDFSHSSDRAHFEVSVGGVRCRVVRRTLFGSNGAWLVCEVKAVADLWEILASEVRYRRGAPIGYKALNALRLRAGIPWFGVDFDDSVIPHEAGLESSHISYTKGCYTGQEIIERVRSRGHVNRRLVTLEFSGGIPSAGTKLIAGAAEAGYVTSATEIPSVASAPASFHGMGYVRREFNALGSKLEWAAGTAEVIELPVK